MPTPRKLKCEVSRIIDHGHSVYTLELRPERRIPRFCPGQFLHLAIDAYQPGDFWPESRVFSIASPPEQRDRLQISYSVVGRYTRRMEKALHAGQLIWVKLPYGEFVIQDHRDVALIAGGTGITAFTAYLLSRDTAKDRTDYLFYGAKRADLLIYRQAIDEAAASNSRLRVAYFTETLLQTSPAETAIMKGRPSAKRVLPALANPKATDFYLSGPPPMLTALSAQLKVIGIADDAVHIDAWGELDQIGGAI